MPTGQNANTETGLYDFACIRYPPPLLQRRSSETDLQLNQRTTIASLCFRFWTDRILPTMRVNVDRRVCLHRSTRV